MKVIIAGGSGQIGQILSTALRVRGDEVVILSRRSSAGAVRTVTWDGCAPGPWTVELEAADVLINLAGRSVNCRYSATNRRQILESRVNSTRAIGLGIAQAARPPRLWLQASTATIYSHRYDASNDERHGILGGDESGVPETWQFSIGVAKAWERAFNECPAPQTRKVLMRSAIVMSPDRGGPFDAFEKLVRRGVGGTMGDGRQFVSWVHDRDLVRAVEYLIEHEDLSSAVNIAAPNPLPNAEFMRVLRRASGVRIGLPAPRWLLEIGTRLMRTESELVLKSRRVVPGRLLEHGFRFDFADWATAAADLCARRRNPQA